jgi:hypothetical protein
MLKREFVLNNINLFLKTAKQVYLENPELIKECIKKYNCPNVFKEMEAPNAKIKYTKFFMWWVNQNNLAKRHDPSIIREIKPSIKITKEIVKKPKPKPNKKIYKQTIIPQEPEQTEIKTEEKTEITIPQFQEVIKEKPQELEKPKITHEHIVIKTVTRICLGLEKHNTRLQHLDGIISICDLDINRLVQERQRLSTEPNFHLAKIQQLNQAIESLSRQTQAFNMRRNSILQEVKFAKENGFIKTFELIDTGKMVKRMKSKMINGELAQVEEEVAEIIEVEVKEQENKQPIDNSEILDNIKDLIESNNPDLVQFKDQIKEVIENQG